MRSHYYVLGVAPTATTGEIRRAYRRRARSTHPDAGGTSEAFASISAAWEVLADPDKRRRYDATLPPPATTDLMPTQPAGGVAPVPPASTPRQPTLSWGTRRLFLAGLAAFTGALVAWSMAELGRVGIAAAAAYLATTAGVLVVHLRRPTAGEGTYRFLTRAAWILAIALAAVGLLSWVMHHSPPPALLLAGSVALYAAAVTGLWHSLSTSTRAGAET